MMTARMTEIRARLAELKKIAEMTGLEQTALYGELSVLRRQMDTEMNTLAEGIIAWKAEKVAAKEALKAEKMAAKEEIKAAKKAEKVAAKEALKAEKKAVKEAIKAAKKAEKVAAKEALKAEKLVAKEALKAEKLAAKEALKAEKKAAKEAAKAEKKAEKLAAKEALKVTKKAAVEELKEVGEWSPDEDDYSDGDMIETEEVTLPDGTNIMVGEDDDVYNEFGEIVGAFCRKTQVVTHYDDDEARGVLLSAARSSMRDAFSPWWGRGAKEALKAGRKAKAE